MTPTSIISSTARYRQQGVALIMAMVFLMLLTILGVTAMTTTSLQEKMAGNVQDKHTAFQAAESALRVGESYVQTTATTALPTFTAAGTTAGHYLPAVGGTTPVWDIADWTNCGGSGGPVCLGGGNAIAGVKTQPAYVIESLGTAQGSAAGSGSLVAGFAPPTDTATGANMYRITGRGTGGTDAAVAIVQGVYRK
ncbi:MAG: PilX N-terminal domain-containing pilus assembly protein [Alphaproteobacteria bacterium]